MNQTTGFDPRQQCHTIVSRLILGSTQISFKMSTKTSLDGKIGQSLGWEYLDSCSISLMGLHGLWTEYHIYMCISRTLFYLELKPNVWVRPVFKILKTTYGKIPYNISYSSQLSSFVCSTIALAHWIATVMNKEQWILLIAFIIIWHLLLWTQ